MTEKDGEGSETVRAKFTWEINADAVLVIPDTHQNIEWAKAILERETGNFDHVVWLGDFVDTHINPPPSSIEATAQFYRELAEREDVTLLLGNHDCPVMESWSHNQRFSRKKNLINECSGFSNSKSQQFNRVVTWDHWKKVRLFTVVNGWLLSHAGVHESFWDAGISNEENLAELQTESEEALRKIAVEPSRLFSVGYCRGGWQSVGGLTWHDFFREFEDTLPVKQLVGHTAGHTIRQIGHSYCIDTGQKSYAIIRRDGAIEFKSIVQTPISNLWVDEPPKVENLNHLVAARHSAF